MDSVKLLTVRRFFDHRGFFQENYHQLRYHELGVCCDFPQDNLSFSHAGVIRGMHFQSAPGQAKLVSVLQGEIFDVVVDIRKGSPTFGKWKGFTLSAENGHQLFIPVGFAHGFCAIREALVYYKVSHPFDPSTEKGFRFDDPEVGIEWPVQNPCVSDRDLQAPLLKEIRA